MSSAKVDTISSTNPEITASKKSAEWSIEATEFNFKQAVLRTSLRVSNRREEPIDFIAKVILMMFDKITLSRDFKSKEYKEPYLIFPALSADQL